MKRVLLIAFLSWPLSGRAQFFVAGIHVNIAPPALRLEIRPPCPSPRHQWIAGYWAWRAGRHAWIGGHWAIPPAPNYVWEPAAWQNVNGSWVFYEGHWRVAEVVEPTTVYQPPPPPMQPIVVEVAPPPPIEEVRPAIPFAGALWIPGYWNWNGATHIWIGGRWSAQPNGYQWEAHRWEHREDGRWEHRPGHWHPGWERHEQD